MRVEGLCRLDEYIDEVGWALHWRIRKEILAGSLNQRILSYPINTLMEDPLYIGVFVSQERFVPGGGSIKF